MKREKKGGDLRHDSEKLESLKSGPLRGRGKRCIIIAEHKRRLQTEDRQLKAKPALCEG